MDATFLTIFPRGLFTPGQTEIAVIMRVAMLCKHFVVTGEAREELRLTHSAASEYNKENSLKGS
jgi:hypothetical protein